MYTRVDPPRDEDHSTDRNSLGDWDPSPSKPPPLERQRSSGSISDRSSGGYFGPPDLLAPTISHAVWKKSEDFMTDLAFFDHQYFEFMWKLMHVRTTSVVPTVPTVPTAPSATEEEVA